MNIPIFVINLARRPDRLDYMADQLQGLGLDWEHVEAHDMYTVDYAVLSREVSETDHVRDMGPGSQCCALTNFDIYRRLVARDIPAALVLQDDIELSPEIKPLLSSLDWLPDDIHLVQFEKYGKPHSSRLLGRPLGELPAGGRTMRRLYSRTGGAACYLVTRAGAEIILREKPILKMPIDHLLFSPNLSPIFHMLGVAVVCPALARQKEGGFASDIQDERQRRKKPLTARCRRLWQDVNLLPSQILALTRGARWRRFGFVKQPAARGDKTTFQAGQMLR